MLINKSLPFIKRMTLNLKPSLTQMPSQQFMSLNSQNLKTQSLINQQQTFSPMFNTQLNLVQQQMKLFATQVQAQASGSLQIKIKRNTATDELQLLEKELPQAPAPQCFFPWTIVKQENRIQLAQKKDIKYSSIKLNAAAMLVRKKHIKDALEAIVVCNKKGGPLVRSVLEAARANAVKRGMQEERLFVKECIVGKELGQKKMDIKARGKFGMMHAPITSIRVVLEEKQPEEFFKMLVKGECPPAIGEVFRKMLYVNQSDFHTVRKLSYMTTARGRYYRKVQFKRLCQMIQKENAKQGYTMSLQKIERNLLEKDSKDYVEDFQEKMEKGMLVSHTERQALFEQNYKKK